MSENNGIGHPLYIEERLKHAFFPKKIGIKRLSRQIIDISLIIFRSKSVPK